MSQNNCYSFLERQTLKDVEASFKKYLLSVLNEFPYIICKFCTTREEMEDNNNNNNKETNPIIKVVILVKENCFIIEFIEKNFITSVLEETKAKITYLTDGITYNIDLLYSYLSDIEPGNNSFIDCTVELMMINLILNMKILYFNELPLKKQQTISEILSKSFVLNSNIFFNKINSLLQYLNQIDQINHSIINILDNPEEQIIDIKEEHPIQLSSQVVEFLFNNKLFDKKDFINILNDFDEIIFELKYLSKSFLKIYEFIIQIKNQQINKNKFLISIYIESFTEKDSDFFISNKNISYVNFNNTQTSIWYPSFYCCSSLKRITIPSSVDLIDTNAFGRCSSLEEVVIESPSQLNSIQGCAFNQCTSLTHFSFPSSISLISFRLFYGCEKLVEITIPSSVTSIEDHAFCGCSSLEKVAFESPSQLNEIKSNAFYECSSLFEIKIPSTVSLIEKEVFMDCFSLKQVIFDDQSPLEKFSEGIFSGCKSLEKINVPQKVTKIERNAFRICLSLSQINLPPFLDEIGDCAFYCCKSMR